MIITSSVLVFVLAFDVTFENPVVAALLDIVLFSFRSLKIFLFVWALLFPIRCLKVDLFYSGTVVFLELEQARVLSIRAYPQSLPTLIALFYFF